MSVGRPRAGRGLAVLAAAALMLLGVALVNGGPILYPDSVAYFIDGERLAHRLAPFAVRPVFYGIAVWLLHWKADFWPALAVQAVIVAHIVALLLRCLGAVRHAGSYLLAVLSLVLLTPVAWHVAHLLPDIFVAVLVLALFLLGFCADRLGRWERRYLVVLAAASASFHLTALPVGAALLASTTIWWWADRRLARPVLVLLPLVLAVAGSLAFNALVWQRLTLNPNSPPALLARILADGPGRDFLRLRCPGIDLELCRYLDRLPATEDGFLWSLLPSVPVDDGKRIKAEAGTVIRGTVATFPAAVAEHMLGNAARQAVTFQSETQLPPDQWAQIQADDGPLARATRYTLQARGDWDRPRLDAVNAVHAVVAGLALLAALGFLARHRRLAAGRPAALLVTVLLALATNAFITGAFGGVFGRYQGRVIWLLPLAAAAAWLSRASAVPPPAGTGFRTAPTRR